MKKVNLVTLVLAGTMVLCLATYAYASSTSNRLTQEKWEYMVFQQEFAPKELSEKLNKLGADGWELSSYSLYNGGANSYSYNALILKRKL